MVVLLPILELIRLEEHSKYGTFGILKINKQVFCATLEPPDVANQPFESNIPAQQYFCRLINTPRFGWTYIVEDVPHRDAVLFHAGNWAEDTEGCIMVAQHFGKLKAKRAVLNSGATFKKFMSALKGYEFLSLTIAEHY